MQQQNKNFISDGWEVKRISELGEVVPGGTPDTTIPEYWDGHILWVTPSEISKLKTKYLYNTERKITEHGFKNSSAKVLPENSIIVCTRATVGDCCINKYEMTTNQGFKSLIPKNNSAEFIYYLFYENKKMFLRLGCGSTFLEISKHDFEKIKFVVPPLVEQKKIAGVLGDWDNTLELLDRQIELKAQQKKYLMQTLLTGDVRLPGFTKLWKETKLGDLCKTFSGGTPSVDKPEYYNGNIPFIRSGEIHNNKTELFLTDLGLQKSSAKMIKKGDLIVALYGATSGEVDISKIHGAINQALLCIRSDKLNNFYTKNLLLNKKTNILNKYLQGGQGNLSAEIIKSIKFVVPPLVEQEAIADVLTAADNEIALLKQKRELVAQQKKYLMQKLLTGQIRIPIKKES